VLDSRRPTTLAPGSRHATTPPHDPDTRAPGHPDTRTPGHPDTRARSFRAAERSGPLAAPAGSLSQCQFSERHRQRLASRRTRPLAAAIVEPSARHCRTTEPVPESCTLLVNPGCCSTSMRFAQHLGDSRVLPASDLPAAGHTRGKARAVAGARTVAGTRRQRRQASAAAASDPFGRRRGHRPGRLSGRRMSSDRRAVRIARPASHRPAPPRRRSRAPWPPARHRRRSSCADR